MYSMDGGMQRESVSVGMIGQVVIVKCDQGGWNRNVEAQDSFAPSPKDLVSVRRHIPVGVLSTIGGRGGRNEELDLHWVSRCTWTQVRWITKLGGPNVHIAQWMEMG